LASQAAPGIVFSSADAPNPLAPGNFAGWNSASFEMTDSNVLSELKEDGGEWVGTVHIISDAVINMTATFFPVEGEADNIQFAGPLMTKHSESKIAIVGGAGKYAGAWGQARCVVAMSDQNTPIYRYELRFQL
jgi:hypothetical protein